MKYTYESVCVTDVNSYISQSKQTPVKEKNHSKKWEQDTETNEA